MKIAIVYGSSTGTTESIAGILKNSLSAHEVTVMNVTHVKEEVLKNSDYILLGSSTWSYGDLQDDFADYIETMTEAVYRDKAVAVFGAGDEAGFSDVFCQAVDIIGDKVKTLGGIIKIEGLKIDRDPSDHLEAIEAFVGQIK